MEGYISGCEDLSSFKVQQNITFGANFVLKKQILSSTRVKFGYVDC